LFLCFRGEFNAASVCASVSAAIGDARAVNNACGKNLDFFLRCMETKLQQGQGPYLDRDEEMIAYVSGDLQNSVNHSWVWQGGETEVHPQQSPTTEGVYLGRESMSGAPSFTMTPISEDSRGWAGWDSILARLQHLQEEQPRRQSMKSPGEGYYPPPRPDSGGRSQSGPGPGSTDRISIKNII